MISKRFTLLPLLAISNAAAVDRLAARDFCGGVTSFFGYGAPTLPGFQSFCTSYLSITTSTSTSTVITTLPTSTVTVYSTTTYTEPETSTAVLTTATTSTPTVTSTSTSFCSTSPTTCISATTTAAANQRRQYHSDSAGSAYTCESAGSSTGTCGSEGYLAAPGLIRAIRKQSIGQCQSLCASERQCNSFSHLPGEGLCTLYSGSLLAQGFQSSPTSSRSASIYWDRTCFDCIASSATIEPYIFPTSPPPGIPIVSLACSCAGVTTPVITTTATSTAPQPLVTTTQTVTTTSILYISTVSTTTTITATAATTTVVQTTTIPNSFSGTYTDSYGDLYGEFYDTDFYGGDLISGTCYDEGPGFNVNGTLVPCADFDGCQTVCSYANRNGYVCKGVSYHPNPIPNGYSTCYLKSSVPQGDPYCGEGSGCEEVDSAILFSRSSSSS